MESFAFATDATVRFAETDAQGIAHNSVYLVWFELARVEYLARFAGGYQALRDQGLEALVLEAQIRYLVPARFAEVLRIQARCGDVRGARFRYEYLVDRAGSPLSSTTVCPAARVGSLTRSTGGAPTVFRGAVSVTTRRCVGVP